MLTESVAENMVPRAAKKDQDQGLTLREIYSESQVLKRVECLLKPLNICMCSIIIDEVT